MNHGKHVKCEIPVGGRTWITGADMCVLVLKMGNNNKICWSINHVTGQDTRKMKNVQTEYLPTWLGCAWITGTVHQRYLLGVCSNLIRACFFVLVLCKMDHTNTQWTTRAFTQLASYLHKRFLIGRGDVTFLHIACVKSTKNFGKLTCVFGRFRNPFFCG